MASNDELLNRLYQFITDELNFHPTVEIVPGLRGGLFDQLADGAAAFSAKGAPVIALSPDYVRWPQEHLKYVVLHETAHHRAGHTNPSMRATAARGVVYERNAAAETYTRSIEVRADEMSAAYIKRFNAWNEKQQLANIQRDINEIRQMLGLSPRRTK